MTADYGAAEAAMCGRVRAIRVIWIEPRWLSR
jgi:hypothetical protein